MYSFENYEYSLKKYMNIFNIHKSETQKKAQI